LRTVLPLLRIQERPDLRGSRTATIPAKADVFASGGMTKWKTSYDFCANRHGKFCMRTCQGRLLCTHAREPRPLAADDQFRPLMTNSIGPGLPLARDHSKLFCGWGRLRKIGRVCLIPRSARRGERNSRFARGKLQSPELALSGRIATLEGVQ
jgi:hypothetical protein